MFTASARHKPGLQLQGPDQKMFVQAAKAVSASMVARIPWEERVQKAIAEEHNPGIEWRILGKCSRMQLYWRMHCRLHLTYKTPQALHKNPKAIICSRCEGKTDITRVTGKPFAAQLSLCMFLADHDS